MQTFRTSIYVTDMLLSLRCWAWFLARISVSPKVSHLLSSTVRGGNVTTFPYISCFQVKPMSKVGNVGYVNVISTLKMLVAHLYFSSVGPICFSSRSYFVRSQRLPTMVAKVSPLFLVLTCMETLLFALISQFAILTLDFLHISRVKTTLCGVILALTNFMYDVHCTKFPNKLRKLA